MRLSRAAETGYDAPMSYASQMSDLPRGQMTVEEFLAWSENQEGRYELVDGIVYAQASERAAYAEMKGLVFLAMVAAIKRRGLDCHAFVDGMAVRVGKKTVYEPDCMVYCGPKLPPDTIIVENPVILFEVISPTTGRNDHTRKVAGYFRIDSVRHYLIVDPDDRLVVHHERGADGVIRSHILVEGAATLDPPGLELPLAELYSG